MFFNTTRNFFLFKFYHKHITWQADLAINHTPVTCAIIWILLIYNISEWSKVCWFSISILWSHYCHIIYELIYISISFSLDVMINIKNHKNTSTIKKWKKMKSDLMFISSRAILWSFVLHARVQDKGTEKNYHIIESKYIHINHFAV